MRLFITLSCLFIYSYTFAQNPIEEKIQQVENGLNLPKTVAKEKGIQRNTIEEQLKTYQINGISVAVVNEGKIEWTKAYGLADASQGNLVNEQMLFQCASIGKIVTALAALHLVKTGKIDLDEDVNQKLKRWQIKENENTQQQKVTLRHLLSHSAGFTDDYGFLGYAPGSKIPNILQILNNEAPQATKVMQVNHTPGTQELYSGGGYLIIQVLIEDISGKPFPDFVQELIFNPLQMTHSTYSNEPDIQLNKPIAVGHKSNGKNLKKKKYHIYPEKAAAGFWTTAEDLAKLMIQIQKEFQGKSDLILNQKIAQALLSPQINHKGLGLNLRGVLHPQAFWHAGNNLGYTALFCGLLHEGKGAIILTNSDGGERIVQEFMASVAYAYDWPVMQSKEYQSVPSELETKLLGTYQATQGERKIEVIIDKNESGLNIKPSAPREKAVSLLRIADNVYTLKDAQDYFRISFTFKDNQATGLKYAQSIGKVLEFQKIK